jgi:tetratricopeptide (TPR) repeat protein
MLLIQSDTRSIAGRCKKAAMCALAFALFCSVRGSAQALDAARAAARAGRIDAAIAALASAPSTAESHSLLCALDGSIERRDAAISECEAAAKAAPSSSRYALELARAYGDKAGHSGALTGLRMVGKIRGSFEHAVELDGKNVEAISDLGQFYIDAPGMVGGGVDKARPLVDQLKPLSSDRSHRLAAMIAAKDKDDDAAVKEYTAAISASHTPEAYVDLANFYRSRKQMDRAAENAKLAIERDTHHGPDTLDAAALLIDLKLNLPVAQTGLRGYLDAPQGELAQYAKAHVLLGKTLQLSGNDAAAQTEFAAALALAHDYPPALKARNR